MAPDNVWNFAAAFDAKYAVLWSGVIGAVIASGISYFGVRSANKSSLARLRVQLAHDASENRAQRQHDADQNKADRKAAIRREIYTEAIEAVHALLASMGGFPERTLIDSATDGDSLQLFLRASSKVWLVAESEAAHLSRDLVSVMSETYLKTLRAAYPLRLKVDAIRNIDKNIVHLESELRRIDMKMAELKERCSDPVAQQAVIDSWKNSSEWLKNGQEERARRFAEFQPQRIAHAKALFQDIRPAQQLIVRLVSALREELDLPGEAEQFLAQHADMERRVLAVFYPPDEVETGSQVAV